MVSVVSDELIAIGESRKRKNEFEANFTLIAREENDSNAVSIML